MFLFFEVLLDVVKPRLIIMSFLISRQCAGSLKHLFVMHDSWFDQVTLNIDDIVVMASVI